MRIGICCGPEAARDAIAAGFDYVELSLQLLKGQSDDYDPTPFEGVGWETSNLFFPAGFRIYGPEADNWQAYARRVSERASALGVRVLVLGSGGIRKAPSGKARDQAEREFVEIAASLHAIAQEYGVAVALESLNRTETDVGNSLPVLATALAAKGAPYTADSYHVLKDWDLGGRVGDPSGDNFWREQLPHPPTHCHLGDLHRNVPDAGDPAIIGFLRRLHQLGYARRVSLEASTRDFPLPEVARRMRELVAAACAG